MPIYDYYCPICNKSEEVSHPISECDNPSEKTQLLTSCSEVTCPDPLNPEAIYGKKWNRVPHANLMYFGTGTHDKGGLKTLEEKSKYAKQRSSEYSKKVGTDEFKKEHIKELKKDFEGK